MEHPVSRSLLVLACMALVAVVPVGAAPSECADLGPYITNTEIEIDGSWFLRPDSRIDGEPRTNGFGPFTVRADVTAEVASIELWYTSDSLMLGNERVVGSIDNGVAQAQIPELDNPGPGQYYVEFYLQAFDSSGTFIETDDIPGVAGSCDPPEQSDPYNFWIEVPLTVTAEETVIEAAEGDTVSNAGTVSTHEFNEIDLYLEEGSPGELTDNGNGTWDWEWDGVTLGLHQILVTATDGGLDATAEFFVLVEGAGPDCSGAHASVESLWPPNHEFTEITVAGVDAPSITIDGIYQDEAVDAVGSGDTAPDARGVGTSSAEVRAERSGVDDGRVYHILFTAEDSHGASCSGEVLVGVPHDVEDAAVDGGALFDSTLLP